MACGTDQGSERTPLTFTKRGVQFHKNKQELTLASSQKGFIWIQFTQTNVLWNFDGTFKGLQAEDKQEGKKASNGKRPKVKEESKNDSSSQD